MEKKNIPMETMAREHEFDTEAYLAALDDGATLVPETVEEAAHKAMEHDPIADAMTVGSSDIGPEDVYKGIEVGVVEAYKTVEETVVGAYKAVEDAVVGAYKQVEDRFVETFVAKEGESVEEAKARIQDQK